MNRAELWEYFSKELGWGVGHQQNIVFEFLMQAAQHAEGGVILDAGSGFQRYKPFFTAATYVGQEHPEAGVSNKGVSTYDILCDVKRIPLKDDSVDVVLSTASLEHIEYPELFFSESHRVLKPGGSLFINVPFVAQEHEIPFDFQRPTRYGLERWHRHAGFESCDVRPTTSSINTAANMLMFGLKDSKPEGGFVTYLSYKLLRRFAYLVRAWALFLCDREPPLETLLPGGWVSTGVKAGGPQRKTRYASAAEFITERAECDAHTQLVDGRILPKP